MLDKIPAVAITAYAKEEDRERALSAGFQIYLAKPVEMTELISVVARAARRDFWQGLTGFFQDKHVKPEKIL